jgi:pSer/pThr/pTyr-binding forkhead associated (FHA) protein
MQVVLVMLKSDGQRRSFPLNREMTVIGRGDDCDFRVPVGDVSRKHCRLVKEEAGLRIEDLGSSNGTFRNGERIQEAFLEPGDYLQIGPAQFVVQIDGAPAEEDITFPSPPTNAPAPQATSSEVTSEPTESENFDPMSALLGEGEDSAVNLDLGGDPDDSTSGGKAV